MLLTELEDTRGELNWSIKFNSVLIFFHNHQIVSNDLMTFVIRVQYQPVKVSSVVDNIHICLVNNILPKFPVDTVDLGYIQMNTTEYHSVNSEYL